MLRAVMAAVLLAALLLAPATAAAVIEPLAWRDSGYDLAAGFRYTFTLRSGRVWTGGCARAIVDATAFKAELCGSHLKVWVGSSVVFDSDVGSESTTLTVTIDCNGSGSVDLSGYGRLGGFGLGQSYRIMMYTETVSAWPTTATSEVQISRQSLGCPGSTITPIQETAPGPDLSGLLLALGSGATVALVVVLVMLGVLLALWLLSRAGGARKLFKSAVG